jgi:uncharacterized membrane protein YoaT (DUF817 family)
VLTHVCRVKVTHQLIETASRPTGNETAPSSFFKQLVWFGYLQARSCVFPVLIFVALAASQLIRVPLPRYDLLLIICLLAQWIMYRTGLETRDEVLVITVFHLLGLIMEIHKVNQGSWSYPEEAYTKIAGVPLYAGFMYASVGSYICQAWRNLQLDVEAWPRDAWAYLAGAAIYVNFFTNAFMPDLRLYIAVLLLIVFWRTKFVFHLHGNTRRISALLSFVIIGFFIWLAENIATYFGAWKYAYQHAGWKMVSWHKITSWGLLVIVSIIIVGQLKRIKARRAAAPRQA